MNLTRTIIYCALLISTVINVIHCSRYPDTSVLAKTSEDQARLFGGIVGLIVSNIDWLPIEVNVIDIIKSFISFFSNLFSSTTSTITAMTD